MSQAMSMAGGGGVAGLPHMPANPAIGGIAAGSGMQTPGQASATGGQGALNELQAALNSNSNAYQGLENQAQQQYYQNAGQVQQGLANSGLGNTTVAQNMMQAPMQTYNNALLNLTGQQQGKASDIYGQAAGVQQQSGDVLAQLLQAMGQPYQQAGGQRYGNSPQQNHTDTGFAL